MNKLAQKRCARLLTSEDVVQEIGEYVEACEDGDQMVSGSVNAVSKGKGKCKEKTPVRKDQFSKGKDKNKGKKNKGRKGE